MSVAGPKGKKSVKSQVANKRGKQPKSDKVKMLVLLSTNGKETASVDPRNNRRNTAIHTEKTIL